MSVNMSAASTCPGPSAPARRYASTSSARLDGSTGSPHHEDVEPRYGIEQRQQLARVATRTVIGVSAIIVTELCAVFPELATGHERAGPRQPDDVALATDSCSSAHHDQHLLRRLPLPREDPARRYPGLAQECVQDSQFRPAAVTEHREVPQRRRLAPPVEPLTVSPPAQSHRVLRTVPDMAKMRLPGCSPVVDGW